jgi:hypothetical protein
MSVESKGQSEDAKSGDCRKSLQNIGNVKSVFVCDVLRYFDDVHVSVRKTRATKRQASADVLACYSRKRREELTIQLEHQRILQ